MKRLVICLDGTWNQVRNPKTVTNVVRIAEAVRPCDAHGVTQTVYYNSGVGTGDFIDRILGGVLGRGVKSNVKRAYAFLSLNYEAGDEMYLFGFSRGAYTARALGGLITSTGILKKQFFDQFDVAWDHYRTPPDERAQSAKPHRDTIHAEGRVTCIGVWDTVGSYGVPAGFGLGALARYFTSWQRGFHDTHISDKVDVGLQALAIDERRRPFSPTFWTSAHGEPVKASVEQVWFCGAHANVGGGYDDQRLAHAALVWMIARVIAHTGLAFDTEYVRRTTQPSAMGTIYRSEKWWPISRVWPFVRPVLPTQAQWDHDAWWNSWTKGELPVNEKVHWTVAERFGRVAPVDGGREQTYRPSNVAPLVLVARAAPSADYVARPTAEEQLLGSGCASR